MRVSISKSKNSESYYITKSYCNDKGKSTSKVVRKLGTLSELTEKLGTDRNGVILWAREQAKLETEKYRDENEMKKVLITFRADRHLDYNGRRFYEGGYLFLQFIYYKLKLDKTCNKLKRRYQCEFDFNAILSDLIFRRILDFQNNWSFDMDASRFLEEARYERKDVCRAFHILAKECEMIQKDVYKNSRIMFMRNDHILYFGHKKYSLGDILVNDVDEYDVYNEKVEYEKEMESRRGSDFQIGIFRDEDNIPLFFAFYPENREDQQVSDSLLDDVITRYGCSNIVYCEDKEPFFIDTIYRNSKESGLEMMDDQLF
ncbi:MAG: hypothetical protein LUF92_12150 [Clostridiales bacterium]|nr:hypothetical protein [Clostridiales bacterium]